MVDPNTDGQPRRVARAEHEGYRADTDDVLEDQDLVEGLINPSARARSSREGAGTGMMPPMMGMGGRGAESATAGSATGAAGAAGSMGMTSAGAGGGAGLGTSGLGAGGLSAGGLGSGGAFGSFPGLGGRGGTIAAGSGGSDHGIGINPATGLPWSPSDPGFAERFGGSSPTTGDYVNRLTGNADDPRTIRVDSPTTTGGWYTPSNGGVRPSVGHYDPTTGRWIGPDGTSYPYDPTSGRYFDPTTGRWVDPLTGRSYDSANGIDLPDSSLTGGGSALGDLGSGLPSGGFGGAGAIGSGGGGGVAGGGVSQVDTGDLASSAAKWDDLSQRMDAVKAQIDALQGTVKFAKVYHPSGAYSSAVNTAEQFAGDSTGNMSDTSTNLSGSAASYAATEQANTDLASGPTASIR